MDISFLRNDALPKLAWIAAVNLVEGTCRVEHGRGVEVSRNFFVEGVWPGPFEEGQFCEYEAFFGSGGVLRPSGELVFVPSCTTIDYLYHHEAGGTFHISNSLPFLLERTGDRLDPFDPVHARICNSIVHGIRRYERRIPTENGSVRRLMYENLVIRGGVIAIEDKWLPPGFDDYESYRDYISGALGGIIDNARDPARQNPLRVLSTQSTGYDSTAVNALAAPFGLDQVVSIAERKESSGYYKRRRTTELSDYGDAIGHHLGFEVTPIDRRYFETHPDTEFLNWATVHCNQNMNLNQVEAFVGDGALLLNGVLGELWYHEASVGADRLPLVNSELEKYDLSGHALSEIRLHVGYVQVAVPYIGARSREDLFRIANSAAMRPWSIGGIGDRPVPRRIAEDAGVPREAFGQQKRATVVEFVPPYLPHGAPLRQEFFAFLRARIGVLQYLYFRAAPRLNELGIAWFRAPFRLWLRKALRRFPRLLRLTEVPRFGDSFNAVLYGFCVNKTARLYRR